MQLLPGTVAARRKEPCPDPRRGCPFGTAGAYEASSSFFHMQAVSLQPARLEILAHLKRRWQLAARSIMSGPIRGTRARPTGTLLGMVSLTTESGVAGWKSSQQQGSVDRHNGLGWAALALPGVDRGRLGRGQNRCKEDSVRTRYNLHPRVIPHRSACTCHPSDPHTLCVCVPLRAAQSPPARCRERLAPPRRPPPRVLRRAGCRRQTDLSTTSGLIA